MDSMRTLTINTAGKEKRKRSKVKKSGLLGLNTDWTINVEESVSKLNRYLMCH